MKTAYPVVISRAGKDFLASVPDCEIDTQGRNLVEAIENARDAISIWCVSTQDDFSRKLPVPSELSAVEHEDGDIVTLVDGDIVTLVDVDLDAYRRMLDTRSIRRNITLPGWLDNAVKKSNMNVSGFVQTALAEHLNVQRP